MSIIDLIVVILSGAGIITCSIAIILLIVKMWRIDKK